MRKILILGAGGFLGSYLSQFSNEQGLSSLQRTVRESNSFLLRLPNGEMHVLKSSNFRNVIEEAFLKSECALVINCIANTSAERCELDSKNAYHVNAMLPLLISGVATKYGVRVIQISTDAVFGQEGSEFKPDEIPVPKSIYGKSKLEGEVNVLGVNSHNLVIRTNFFGNFKAKQTLFNYFFDNLVKRNPVIGFTNQIFTPMYVEDLVINIFALSKSNESGIFHMGGDFIISKYDLALNIAQSLELPKKLVIPEIYENDPKGPSRNLNISLDSSKAIEYIVKRSSLTQGISQAIKLG
jgi:dTDP-4-dehydrorhamnose reductase